MSLTTVNLICVCGAKASHQCSTTSWAGLNVADAAWHSVWLYGDWHAITREMTPAERNHAADAVARYSRQLALADGNLTHTEPKNLRWWLDPEPGRV
ncbi:hypothetical protein ACFV0T_26660 [Streptomyces sp. NPDC059582]|uniref:hypothetical protein n=1 Tax=Streptomyces sp. NPDC059582 TaxID=3346875 RepID=UPI0036C19707